MVAIAETSEEARRIAVESPFVKAGDMENFIIGDPDTVTEKISEYIEIGIEHFILRFLDFPKTDGAKLFAEKVIPNF